MQRDSGPPSAFGEWIEEWVSHIWSKRPRPKTLDQDKAKKQRANNLPNARKVHALVSSDEANQRTLLPVPANDLSRGRQSEDKE